MAGYVGIQTQKSRNNAKSIMLLVMFPIYILVMTWIGFAIWGWLCSQAVGDGIDWDMVNDAYLHAVPWIVGIVAIWFLCAYRWNAKIVEAATGAMPLDRRTNPRVYNITENLCMRVGMEMPKLYIVNDPNPNAFASGINDKSYAVTVTTGLLDCLNDVELAGVIAHELTHIRNNDTRLLITSIVFVGIISMLLSIAWMLLRMFAMSNVGSRSRNSKNDSSKGIILLILIIAVVVLAVLWLLTSLNRFAISRKREYLADAGGAELSGEPWSLASALRKISGRPGLANINGDMAALFIARPKMKGLKNLFATHPDIEERIHILESF